jgi:hypothetical protein
MPYNIKNGQYGQYFRDTDFVVEVCKTIVWCILVYTSGAAEHMQRVSFVSKAAQTWLYVCSSGFI